MGLSKRASAIAAGCPARTASQAANRHERDPDVVEHLAKFQTVPAVAKETAAEEGALDFMRGLMADKNADPRLRLSAAKALAGFTLIKPGEQGKKEQRKAAAEEAGENSRFGLRRPKLTVVT